VVFAFLSVAVLVASFLLSLIIKDESKKAYIACLGASLGSVAGLLSFNGNVVFATNMPSVTFAFGIDPLSRFFLLVILGVSLLISFYGLGYVRAQRNLIGSVPFFPLLVAAMEGVLISRDAFSFLVIWEIMSLASFFLVTAEHENKEVQNAGWIYLIATHLATAFLMAFFVIMAKASGSMLFSKFTADPSYTPFTAGLLFVFAVIGFGTKAGIFPFHVWLPRAHPAAPSYISALMSGVMIKTGIYGILRTLTFLGSPPMWWGTLLVIVGVVSAVAGILYALMQHDLKRLLAYSSVENIGIIVIGLGVGVIGAAKGNMPVAALGFGGAIFHVLNHALFKSLLFLCAGNVAHAAHYLSIDSLGGLIRKLPRTAFLFLIAALSICGLPPFNGFISEWFVYLGVFSISKGFSGYPILLAVVGIIGLAFVGGLAVACFTKVFGIVFLGEPRNDLPKDCHEAPRLLIYPMGVLALLCAVFGIFPFLVLPFVSAASMVVLPGLAATSLGEPSLTSLSWISVAFAVLILLTASLFFIRKMIFRKRSVKHAVTWDCGYAFPTPRMQYTAASFAEPVGTFFSSVLKPSASVQYLSGIFPKAENFEEYVSDRAENGFFEPLFERIGRFLLFVRRKRKNTAQSYLALIFITLMALFILEVWFGI